MGKTRRKSVATRGRAGSAARAGTAAGAASIQIPPQLVDAVKNRRAVLFAGAGISQEALGGLNGWVVQQTLGQEIRKSYPDYNYESRSFEDVCDEYEVLHDQMTLVQRLADMIPKNCAPLASHLAAVKAFRFIITTNWDLLFEAAYQKHGIGYQLLVEERDAPTFAYDSHNLLKIHGSKDRPLTLIARSEDYGVYRETHRQLLQKVEGLLSDNTVLFVGYGLRDSHLQHLLAQIRYRRAQWTQRAFVVGKYDEVRTKLLENRKMQVLPYDAKVFLPELNRLAGV